MILSQRELQCCFEKYERIFFLSDLNLGGTKDALRVYRYMQYADLKLSLENNNFAFMTPEKWEDKLEQRYWNTDYSKLNPCFVRPNFACLCVTPENHDDSAASWKMYRREIFNEEDLKKIHYNNELVRLTLDFDAFLSRLNSWAENCKTRIYICAIDYSFGQEQIKNLPKDEDRFFPFGFDTEDYFKILCVKRPDYSFEREIRLFAVEPQDGSCKIGNGLLLLNEFDIAGCITEVLISPAKKECSKVLDVDIVKCQVGNFLKRCGNNVKCCRLYDDCKCPIIDPKSKEGEEMKILNSNTKYLTTVSIEEFACDGESFACKFKGDAGYSLKLDSNQKILFRSTGKDESLNKLLEYDSNSFFVISNLKDLFKEFLWKAFELKKSLVIELNTEPEIYEKQAKDSDEKSVVNKFKMNVSSMKIQS